MTIIFTCEVFVTAESLLVSMHPTRSDFPHVSVSKMKTVLEDISYFRDVTFSENPTRGSRLQCIHEGQSEMLNEDK